ncbi:MAG: TPR end-of-group domain-containing protein [Deltaproteobacteria bacterium]
MEKDNDFEIRFFEQLLARKPDFAQALTALGEAYTRKGQYGKGLDADLRLLKLRPLDETVHYNLACDYSLLRESERCLKSLEKALVLGYRDFRLVEEDSDLSFIKNDVRFWELLEKYRYKRRRTLKKETA